MNASKPRWVFRVRTTEDEEFFVVAEDMVLAIQKAEAWAEKDQYRGFVDLVEWLFDMKDLVE